MFEHDPVELAEIGRNLGYDLARHGRMPGTERWPAAVLEGHAGALARRATPLPADRFVRKWLQLRLGAYKRSRVVAPDVTPDLLRVIDVALCPVLRVPLTHGERAPTDWSVDRLNNDGAYARNNLAVMSTQANRAKGSLGYGAVYDRAQQPNPTDGLQPCEWLRMAALMLGPSFATRPHLAPAIPLVAPIPIHSARPGMQQVQHVFTIKAGTQAGKNRLIKDFRPACPGEDAGRRLGTLADAMHAGLKGLDFSHDVWLRPGVMEALLAWRAALDGPRWALVGEISRRLAGGRVVPASRLEGWCLATHGRFA